VCFASLKAEEETRGQQVKCPRCLETMLVPTLARAQEVKPIQGKNVSIAVLACSAVLCAVGVCSMCVAIVFANRQQTETHAAPNEKTESNKVSDDRQKQLPVDEPLRGNPYGLYGEYLRNEAAADKKYLGKIVEMFYHGGPVYKDEFGKYCSDIHETPNNQKSLVLIHCVFSDAGAATMAKQSNVTMVRGRCMGRVAGNKRLLIVDVDVVPFSF
jgi:hypothetical protein